MIWDPNSSKFGWWKKGSVIKENMVGRVNGKIGELCSLSQVGGSSVGTEASEDGDEEISGCTICLDTIREVFLICIYRGIFL